MVLFRGDEDITSAVSFFAFSDVKALKFWSKVKVCKSVLMSLIFFKEKKQHKFSMKIFI